MESGFPFANSVSAKWVDQSRNSRSPPLQHHINGFVLRRHQWKVDEQQIIFFANLNHLNDHILWFNSSSRWLSHLHCSIMKIIPSALYLIRKSRLLICENKTNRPVYSTIYSTWKIGVSRAMIGILAATVPDCGFLSVGDQISNTCRVYK